MLLIENTTPAAPDQSACSGIGIGVAQSTAFLEAVFGDAEMAWVAAFPDQACANFTGGWGMARVAALIEKGADVYFSQGQLVPSAKSRKGGNMAFHRLIAVDDVGGKVPLADWEARFANGCPRPCAIAETSPGNFQYFWRLEQPIPAGAGDEALRHLRALLGEHGLTDPGVLDDAHYFRLGCGHNSKQKHKDANAGIAPPVRYTELDLTRTVTLDGFAEAVFGQGWRNLPLKGGAPSAGTNAGNGGFSATMDGWLMTLADAIGLRPTQGAAGKINALCPNMAEHTPGGGEEEGFAFLSDGTCKCHHAHCGHLKSPDFRRIICDRFDAEMADRKAKGLPCVADSAEGLRREMGRQQFMDAPIEAIQWPLLLQNSGDGASTPGGGATRTKKAMHVVAAELMAAKGLVPFLDPTGEVWLWVNGRLCCLNSKGGFRTLAGWLSDEGLDVTGAARTNLVQTLEGRAAKDPARKVFYRAANGGTNGAQEIYVNMMRDDGRGVRVDAAGWSLVPVQSLPLPMAHREGGLPQPEPVKATDGVSFMDRLGRHIPLKPVQRPGDPTDEGVQQRAVILAFLSGQFFRIGAVPHLLLAGEQGGGKTTIARRLNDLTDPDVAAVLSRLPGKPGEAIAQLRQQSNAVLDNTSSLPTSTADLLCVLATGGADSARKLYSDNERAVSDARCSIIFTSVLDAGITHRPDLLNRMLTFPVAPIARNARKGEGELNAAWAQDLPNLWADLYDLLAVGLRRIAFVRGEQAAGRLPPPPRLADVAQFAEAASEGLGWPPGLLTRALNTLQADASSDQLARDPIAFRLRALLQAQPGHRWVGSLDELERAVWAHSDGPPQVRNANFANALARAKGPLRDIWGIEINDKRTKHTRLKEITYTPNAP